MAKELNNIYEKTEWRKKLPKLKDKLNYLLKTGSLSDVTLLLGEEKFAIPAHKFMLSASSRIFQNLLERSEPLLYIEIREISPDICYKFLEYIYTEELKINSVGDALGLAKVATKFEIFGLMKECASFLKLNIIESNALSILNKASELKSKDLETEAIRFICLNVKGFLHSPEFLNLNHEALCAILSSDELQVDELTLFRASLKWAEAECSRNDLIPNAHNMRDILGNAIFLIRFPLLSAEIISLHITRANILTAEELVSLYSFKTLRPVNRNAAQNLPFISRERKILSKQFALSRFERVGKDSNRWTFKGGHDIICFQANRAIVLLGFGIYGAREISKAKFYMNYSIEELNSFTDSIVVSPPSPIIDNREVVLSQSTIGERLYVLLGDKGIHLKEKTWYRLSTIIQGPTSDFGEEGQEEITLDCGASGIITFKFQDSKGSNNGTCVRTGQFPEFLFRIL